MYKLDHEDGTVLFKCSPTEYNNYGGLTYDGKFLLNVDAYGIPGSGIIYKWLFAISCWKIGLRYPFKDIS